MKKNTFYMVALLLAGTVMTACSGGDDITSDITPEPQLSSETGVVELSGTLGSKGDVTRAIDANGKGTWEPGDKFAVYYETPDGHASAVATVNSVNDDKSANFTATLHSPKAGNNDVTLVYPATAHDGKGGFKTDALMKQGGTLDYINANGLDIETATTTMKVEGMNATLTENVTMDPQVCLYTLYLKDNFNNYISAKKLEISDGTHNYTITSSDATTDFTIALLPIENADFTFTATTTKEGKLYTKQNATLANCTAANVGDVIFADGNIYKVSNGTGVIYSVSFKNKTLVRGRFSYNYLNLSTITPVAMIAYVGENGSVETGSDYRGLAIAMNDVMSKNDAFTCVWSSEKTADCTSNDKDKVTDATVACNTKNGISMTASLVSHSDGSTHKHFAANAAYSYNKQRPDGTSEWFLPSVGQWQLIAWGLMSKATGTSYTTPITTVLSDENGIISKINTVLNSAGASWFNNCYWLSTECSVDSAWSIAANGYAYKNDKHSGSRIRPVIAF